MPKRESREERKKWREHAADFFELPRELISDLPRLTLIGNAQLYLENHRGVIEYNEKLLRLKTGEGELLITGNNLVIKNFYSEEIFVEGDITAVEYSKER